jgi:hypothetical protein
VIESLASVSLDDVVGAAPLLTRVDHKYVVPSHAVGELVERLGLPVLEIDGRRSFRYESVYFDTPEWGTFLDAAHGRRKRVKVRTRTYVDAGTCKLEIKSKGYRERTTKVRLDYDPYHRMVLNASAHSFLADRATTLPPGRLSAALTTTYRRATLADLAAGSRVTIDTDLMCTDPHGARVGTPGFAIVETKSATGSCPSDRLLWRAGYRPEPISKFALGAAGLHPELPHNKWRRPIERYVRTL